MWIYYSVNVKDLPMTVRSSTEISLLTISAIYIIRNKWINQNNNNNNNQILPMTSVPIANTTTR